MSGGRTESCHFSSLCPDSSLRGLGLSLERRQYSLLGFCSSLSIDSSPLMARDPPHIAEAPPHLQGTPQCEKIETHCFVDDDYGVTEKKGKFCVPGNYDSSA